MVITQINMIVRFYNEKKKRVVMKLSEKQAIFTCMVAEFLTAICACREVTGVTVSLGEVYRTEYQQRRYVKTGKSKTYLSKHLKHLAIDLNLFIHGKYITDPEKYRVLGELWEEIGGKWGGRFGVRVKDYSVKVGWDSGHFEYKE